MGVLYETESVCPLCLKKLPGTILERAGAVFIRKRCPEHGDFEVKIDPDARLYKERMALYFQAPLKYGELENYHLYLSDRCNLACPICFTSRVSAATDLTIPQIEAFLRSRPVLKKVALLGGEPTLCPDLFQIISLVRAAGGEPVLCTNGIRFAEEPAYAERLAATGLREVHLQFDGFDDEIYLKLRGRRLLQVKLTALDNLARSGIRVILLATIEAGLNDAGLDRMIDFATSRPQIRGLVFRSAGASGAPGGKESLDIFPADILKMVESQTGGRIRVADVEAFQRVAIRLVRMFNASAPSCFKDRYYVLYRGGCGSYVPVGDLFDLDLMGQALQAESYRDPARLLRLLNPAGYLRDISARQLLSIARFFVQQISPGRSSGFTGGEDLFILGVAGICDRYNYDRKVVETCPSSLYINDKVYRKLPEGFILSNIYP